MGNYFKIGEGEPYVGEFIVLRVWDGVFLTPVIGIYAGDGKFLDKRTFVDITEIVHQWAKLPEGGA